MTLFRPAVIEAQRRRVFGCVTLHQPARLAAFTAVATISVAIGTAYLALGQFARKETVAGWIAPEAGLSAVYAPRGGVADAVLVRQGDYVAEGQPLMRLALDVAGADGAIVPLQRAQTRARLTEIELQATASAQRFSEESVRLSERASATFERFAAEDARLMEAARGSTNRFAQDDARLADRAAAARADASRIETSRDLAQGQLAIAERAEGQARVLISKGYMASTEADRRAQAAISARAQVGDLNRQIQSRLAEAQDFEGQRQSLRAAHKAEMADISRQRATLAASRSGETGDLMRQRQALGPARASEASQLRSAKTQLETGLTELSVQDGYVVRAPIAGRVASLNIRAGEAANPNVPLISLAPKGSPMEAQILVPTRAAGFITEGQRVRLMVDAFPFQQFGAIQGEVREIARSALRPGEINAPFEFKEPVYRIRVALTGPGIQAYGKDRPLQPGMTLKADVITDKRTFLSWLFDPLLAARARAAAG
jgi:membrane fusion protein